MKKIINGKKYDTDTAIAVCEWDNGLPRSDFKAMKRKLYRKKTGEFFVYNWGGAATCYAEMHGQWSSEGSEIVPCDENEARNFVEKYGTADEYEKLFGEVEE